MFNYSLVCSAVFSVLIIRCFATYSTTINNSYVTVCRTFGWWSIINVNKSAVMNLFTDDEMSLASLPPPYNSQIPDGMHPIVFEMQSQMSCKNKHAPFKTSFIEFKLEVPFVQHSKFPQQTFMFKPLVYASTKADVEGSTIIYGLPTFLPQAVSMISKEYEGSYNLTYNDSSLYAVYDNQKNNEWQKISSLINNGSTFDLFVDIMSLPWLCHNIIGELQCAYNYFDFENADAMARDANMSLVWSGDDVVLPDLDIIGNHIESEGFTQNSFGTAQINVTLYITSTMQCPT